jgi:ATP-dependent Lhr-like helicase
MAGRPREAVKVMLGLIVIAEGDHDSKRLSGALVHPLSPMPLLRQLGNAPLDLGDRLPNLVPARLVRGELELALHFGASQPARFELAQPFGIGGLDRLACFLLLFFPFFHPLGEAGFRVDESFSGVTHHRRLYGSDRPNVHIDRTTRIAVVSDRALDLFHPAVRRWFSQAFGAPTRPQQLGWPVIARGGSTLLLAPTGSGKTLAAFLWCLNRLMFTPAAQAAERCRVLYVSPLKALASDVERNLRAPLAGIAAAAAEQGDPVTRPDIAMRTGDTAAADRARFLRTSADILITTPESLFLLLTSRARERLLHVETVIVDEIHALVPGKRGAHLALSLERLEALRGERGVIQRIGLSATQRPLDEVARFLGGARPRRPGPGRRAVADDVEQMLHDQFGDDTARPAFRPVTIVDAGGPKQLDLRIELPVEDIERSDRSDRSIWASIHPRLLDLIRTHRSTLLFVNNRRLAERLAAALNDLAGEPLVRSHHGSLAREARRDVEELLKGGHIRGLVATSSLELGIDMGAIDLVVQIEAPPSVASGLQRIGRAGHQIGAVSRGVIFPKFRGDLVACAAVAQAMHEGTVESTHYPRNPLDVLAQQIVAMAAMDRWGADDLFARVRCAAPYATLGRRMFDSVLDMLSGRFPSDDFAALKPRITWDRVRNRVSGREGAARVAVANAGTIPDRGLYGVFLSSAGRQTRVGELDEEMVFETKVGDAFTLGATTWRVNAITHDRVLVSPAPGQPGKLPFWHGDRAGRPVELGYAIGRLIRELRSMPKGAAVDRLTRRHDLDAPAAEILLRYLDDQAASGAVPDDETIVIERCLDDLGDWRVCLLSPLGSRVLVPWAMAVQATVRRRTGADVEVMWGDEGFVVRFPDAAEPPDPALLLPAPNEIEGLVAGHLATTSLFAARFRETAARALLLPRRRPGLRTPLWQQRKRAADLLAAASRYGSFPALVETYREILHDHFDMPALAGALRKVAARTLRVRTVDSRTPSPFAASLLFSYVANYIYDGDAPLAERRAQALSVDQAQLGELIGDAELRGLIDPAALDSIERRLQHLDDAYRVRTADALHDLLIHIGDLSLDEIRARCAMPEPEAAVRELEKAKRIVALPVAGESRFAAAEDAARYRDALGLRLPRGLPEALAEPVRDPAGDLVMRYVRSRGPSTARDVAGRFGLARDHVESLLVRLTREERLIEGEFRPGGVEREWIAPDVLRQLRRRSLARLRREVEPVDVDALGRLLVSWHGIHAGRRGPEPLLDAVEQLQGAAIPASALETDVLPARIDGYEPGLLDTLMAAGEVVWVGVEPLGDRDGRIALYLTDHVRRLRPPAPPRNATPADRPRGRAADVLAYLGAHGASFFGAVHEGSGGGFPGETVEALWDLVWRGLVTNDTLHPLRAFLRGPEPPAGRSGSRRRTAEPEFRSRRLVPPRAEGRWSLVPSVEADQRTATARGAATATQLLTRFGVVTRETVAAEAVAGGFTAVYQVLKAMEEAGRIRRGYFVAGLGGAQFAAPAAIELLRSMRDVPETPRTCVLAATDPANPYGASVRWPARAGPTRSAGARVVLVDGALAGYLRRGERELLLFAPSDEPRRTDVVREVARALRTLARTRGMLVADIDGAEASAHPAAGVFVETGFVRTAMGLQLRPVPSNEASAQTDPSDPNAL